MVAQISRGQPKRQRSRQSAQRMETAALRLVLRPLDDTRLISVPLDAHELVLGRRVDGYLPDIDLEPLGGADHGVSRRHARFALREMALTIEDLGSTNGTRINGFAIAPHQPYRLRSGDEIEFGTLRLTASLLRVPSK